MSPGRPRAHMATNTTPAAPPPATPIRAPARASRWRLLRARAATHAAPARAAAAGRGAAIACVGRRAAGVPGARRRHALRLRAAPRRNRRSCPARPPAERAYSSEEEEALVVAQPTAADRRCQQPARMERSRPQSLARGRAHDQQRWPRRTARGRTRSRRTRPCTTQPCRSPTGCSCGCRCSSGCS